MGFGAGSDSPYNPGLGPPSTECHHLQWKRRWAKRVRWPLCLRIEAPVGLERPLPPPFCHLAHQQTSALQGLCWSPLINHSTPRGQARRLRFPPHPIHISAVAWQHGWSRLHCPILWPLRNLPQWSHHTNNVVKYENWSFTPQKFDSCVPVIYIPHMYQYTHSLVIVHTFCPYFIAVYFLLIKSNLLSLSDQYSDIVSHALPLTNESSCQFYQKHPQLLSPFLVQFF